MLDMLRRCKVDKWKAIRSYNCQDPNEVLYDPHHVPIEPNRTALTTLQLELSIESSSILDQVRMYLPGRILYLVKTYTEDEDVRLCCCSMRQGHPHYAPFWVADRTEFQEVLVSVRM